MVFMIGIIKQEIIFDKSLRQGFEFICEFSHTIPTFINGYIHKVAKINNAVQNSVGFTKCDNHNYRKYDDREYDIKIIRGSSSFVDDMKKLYRDEFDEAKEECNARQTRENRKIKDYFTHVSNNFKSDLVCEVIIKLWNKKYWDIKNIGI